MMHGTHNVKLKFFCLYVSYQAVFNRLEKHIPCYSQSNITEGSSPRLGVTFFFLLFQTGLEARAKRGGTALRPCASVLLYNRTVCVWKLFETYRHRLRFCC